MWESGTFTPVPTLSPYSSPDSQTKSIKEEIRSKIQYLFKHTNRMTKKFSVNHHLLLIATYENAWTAVV